MKRLPHTRAPWFDSDSWIDQHRAVSSEAHGALALVVNTMDHFVPILNVEPDYLRTADEAMQIRKQRELNANLAIITKAPELYKFLMDMYDFTHSGRIPFMWLIHLKDAGLQKQLDDLVKELHNADSN